MLKKVGRLSILIVLVLSFMVGVSGAESAKAIAVPTISVQIISFPEVWNGSYDYSTWETWQNDLEQRYENEYDPDVTFGMIQQEFSAFLGYPVVVYSYVCDEYPIVDMFQPSSSAKVSDYLDCWEGYSVVVFKAASSTTENLRLTLFGYVNDDGKSCVLWSLDGSRNHNVAEKCGGGAELVCTVKLVKKNLKYDCDGGYDLLGQQIVNDPKWLAWADKFASMNGNK
jgi:hypothetical protein